MESNLKCPGCGAEVNESAGSLRLGFLLVGRREIACPGCGIALVATASISMGDAKGPMDDRVKEALAGVEKVARLVEKYPQMALSECERHRQVLAAEVARLSEENRKLTDSQDGRAGWERAWKAEAENQRMREAWTRLRY